VDTSIAGDGFSSVAAVLCSSPSEERSVDFLHSTKLVVNQVRSPSYKYYSGMVFTYKLDRTIVTVGAPSMLAMSISPASVGASFSAWAATGSSAPVVALGSGLLSSVGACVLTTLVVQCIICDTSSSTVGAGLRLISVGLPTVSQSSPLLDQRGWTMESPATTQNSIVSTQYFKTSTRLLYSRNLSLSPSASWRHVCAPHC
jgi:hypothetical protein